MRQLADAIAETCGGMAAVFSGADGNGYSFAMVARTGDLRPLGKAMTAALSGRGGGKPNFQQGSVKASRADIEAFFAGKQGGRPMYMDIGKDMAVRDKSIIGIFDLDNTTTSKRTREFLSRFHDNQS